MRIAPLLAAFAAAAGLVGFSAATGQPPDKAKKTDSDLVRLQGEWVVTKVEVPRGEGPPDELLTSLKITVRENRVTAEFIGKLAGKEESVHALLVLDSTKTPRHVDVIPADAKGQPRRMQSRSTGKGKANTVTDHGPHPPMVGVYKLDGDTLTVCVEAGEGQPRPTELKAAPPKDPKSFRADDQGYALIQLTRKK